MEDGEGPGPGAPADRWRQRSVGTSENDKIAGRFAMPSLIGAAKRQKVKTPGPASTGVDLISLALFHFFPHVIFFREGKAAMTKQFI